MTLSSIRYSCSQKLLNDWALIKVTGNDRVSFFQGQVTNDLNILEEKKGQLTARLSRNGKLQSFFFIAKLSTHLLLLCPKNLVSIIKEDFEKFIIMDDVELEVQERPLWINFNYFLHESRNEDDGFDFNYYGLNARLVFDEDLKIPRTNEVELEEIRILNGWPHWGQDVDQNNFINESYLNEIAISYKKGCFLGQETAAKIENNRGAAYFPVLLKILNEKGSLNLKNKEFQIEGVRAGIIRYQVRDILQANLFRDFRVNNRELSIELNQKNLYVQVMLLPFFKAFNKHDIALELYHLGVEAFQAEQTDDAINYMTRAIAFDASLADAYESLGVILGRQEKFEMALSWMDKLLEVSPLSVMAHTNKSLYFMRLGKIEEAEAEKSLATVKSFAVFGEEAKIKKQLELENQRKIEDLSRREKMFLQVLEIDDEDTIALYGMADIFFSRKEFDNAILNLEKIIQKDPKYSAAYLLLGKAYEAIDSREKAKMIYQAGITTASRLGDMMPANEMQSRLNQLIMLSRLN